MTLTEFLLAQIVEDEALAWAALRDADRGAELGWENQDRLSLPADQTSRRYSPARVLAECEVKRRIVGLHGGEHACWEPNHPVVGHANTTWRKGDCTTLRILALPKADHPDYDDAWRP